MKPELVSEERLEQLFKRWFGPVPNIFDDRVPGEIAKEAFGAGARAALEAVGVRKVFDVTGNADCPFVYDGYWCGIQQLERGMCPKKGCLGESSILVRAKP